jgi:hypothetical protein
MVDVMNEVQKLQIALAISFSEIQGCCEEKGMSYRRFSVGLRDDLVYHYPGKLQ